MKTGCKNGRFSRILSTDQNKGRRKDHRRRDPKTPIFCVLKDDRWFLNAKPRITGNLFAEFNLERSNLDHLENGKEGSLSLPFNSLNRLLLLLITSQNPTMEQNNSKDFSK